MSYNIKKLFGSYYDRYFDKFVSENEMKFWIDSSLKFSNSDFLLLLNPQAKNPVIFNKNYNLKFEKDQSETIFEIINSVSKTDLDKINKIDELCVKFIKNNPSASNTVSFQLRTNVNLIEGSPASLVRNVYFLHRRRKEVFHTVVLVVFTDVTDLMGLNKNIKVNVRYKETENETINENIIKLNEQISKILESDTKLSKRENEVLKLIGEGLTSKEISEKLGITINTVNTHRQNLIKKFNVKNTSALISKIRD